MKSAVSLQSPPPLPYQRYHLRPTETKSNNTVTAYGVHGVHDVHGTHGCFTAVSRLFHGCFTVVSRLFHGCCQSGMKESRSTEVVIPNFRFDIFLLLLDYLYVFEIVCAPLPRCRATSFLRVTRCTAACGALLAYLPCSSNTFFLVLN